MAVMRWIWGNANSADQDKEEYQIRLCDESFAPCRDDLMVISNRLVSVMKRRGERRTRRCWFAGVLHGVYVVALGGEQNDLLGTRYTGSRGLFCTMALGFTGEDIRLYRREDALFEPLKKLLRELNEDKDEKRVTCQGGLSGEELAEYCRRFAESASGETWTGGNNIVKSTPQTDEALWRQSLSRPAMLGILSVDDAQRLLDHFHQGVATVLEDADLKYIPREDTGSQTSRWEKEAEEGRSAARTEQDRYWQERKERYQQQQEQRRRAEEERRREESAQFKALLFKVCGGLLLVGGAIAFFLHLLGRG